MEQEEIKQDTPPVAPEGTAEAIQTDEPAKPKKKPAAPKPKDLPEPVIPKKGKGQVKKEEPPKIELTPESITKQVKGIHAIAGMFIEGAAIGDPEAALLGDAIYQVVKDSDLAWLAKYGKYVNLAVTIAIVEMPVAARVRAIQMQKVAAKKQQEDSMKSEEKTGVDAGAPLRLVDGVAVG